MLLRQICLRCGVLLFSCYYSFNRVILCMSVSLAGGAYLTSCFGLQTIHECYSLMKSAKVMLLLAVSSQHAHVYHFLLLSQCTRCLTLLWKVCSLRYMDRKYKKKIFEKQLYIFSQRSILLRIQGEGVTECSYLPTTGECGHCFLMQILLALELVFMFLWHTLLCMISLELVNQFSPDLQGLPEHG